MTVETLILHQTCTGCSNDYPATTDYFHQMASGKNSLKAECKKCTAKRQKAYLKTHKKKVAAQRKVYSHSEKGVRYQKEYYQKYYATINGYLRQTFCHMKYRCTNPKAHNYNRYGGRGISIFWKTVNEFINYVINVLKIDPRGLQVDRIDNNGHYEPGNIRFVTRKENMQNRS